MSKVSSRLTHLIISLELDDIINIMDKMSIIDIYFQQMELYIGLKYWVRDKKDTLRYWIYWIGWWWDIVNWVLFTAKTYSKYFYIYLLYIDDSCGKTQWQLGNRPIISNLHFISAIFIHLAAIKILIINCKALISIQWICIPSFFFFVAQSINPSIHQFINPSILITPHLNKINKFSLFA